MDQAITPIAEAPSSEREHYERKIAAGIEFLCLIAHQCSREHGFWADYEDTIAHLDIENDAKGTLRLLKKYTLDVKLSKMALVGSEIGEAVEGIRKPHPDEHCPEFTSEEIELADALIRIGDYAEKFGLRLGEAVIAKMRYNEGREYLHGKGA